MHNYCTFGLQTSPRCSGCRGTARSSCPGAAHLVRLDRSRTPRAARYSPPRARRVPTSVPLCAAARCAMLPATKVAHPTLCETKFAIFHLKLQERREKREERRDQRERVISQGEGMPYIVFDGDHVSNCLRNP